MRVTSVIVTINVDVPYSVGPRTEQINNVEEIEFGEIWLHLHKEHGLVSFPTYNVIKVEEIENESN